MPEKQAVVGYEPEKVTVQAMIEAINKAGYKASLAPSEEGS